MSKLVLKDLIFSRDSASQLKKFQKETIKIKNIAISVGLRYKTNLGDRIVYFTPLAFGINKEGEDLLVYYIKGEFSAYITKCSLAEVFTKKVLNKKQIGQIKLITKAVPDAKSSYKQLLKALAALKPEDLNKATLLVTRSKNPNLICSLGQYLLGEPVSTALLLKTAVIANKRYVNVNAKESSLTDNQYDALKEIILARDPKKGAVLENVGAPVAKKEKKVKLDYQMGSLRKTKPDSKSVGAWVARIKDKKYILSDKLDGISLALKYLLGKLVAATTRGDGFIGQDVLRHVLLIPNIPKSIPEKKEVTVRTECMLGNAVFEAMRTTIFKNEKKKEPYSTARNMAGGMLNRTTPIPKILAKMHSTAYTIMSEESNLDKEDQLKLLKKWGFDVVPYQVVLAKDLNEGMLTDYVNKRKKKVDYEMDGAVIESNSASIRSKLGNETEELKPKYARAFKTGDTEQLSVVIDHIEWRLSKHGFLKPRAWINKSTLGGVSVNKATAFNARFVSDNKLGPGAKVLITRAGDVIPHILKVVTKAAKAQMPDKKVFGEYDWNETFVDLIVKSGSSSEHSAVKSKQILFFFKSLGIDAVGPGVIDKFYAAGYTTIASVINMSIPNITAIDGFQQKSAEKIYENIRAGLIGIPIYKLAVALPFFGRSFGERRMKALYKAYGDEMFSRWVGKTKREAKAEISQLKGFKNFSIQFVDGIPQFNLFLKANSKIIKLSKKKSEASALLNGVSFVFTGFRDKTLEKAIEDNGGAISGSVSSSTTYLVAKDATETSVKLEKARKAGVKVVDADFVKKMLLKKGISL